jgi:ribosomal protein S6
MSYYETVVIFTPDEDMSKENIKKFTKVIQTYSKEKRVKVEDMGIRNLAYKLRDKYTQGYYAVFTWQRNGKRCIELRKTSQNNRQCIKIHNS